MEQEAIEVEKKEVDWQTFKVRCSAIHMVMSDSRSNPVLTEKQEVRMNELESKDSLTDKMKIELADLLVKKENSTKVILSDMYISYLMEEYAWRTERMVRVSKELMDIPQLQKGTIVEPQSLKLLSLVDGVEYTPNKDENGQRIRLYNDYLSGEIDAYYGKSIYEIEILPDVKSIFDYPTFLCKINEPLTKANDLQVKGYLDITCSPEGFIGNCLVDIDSSTLEKLRWRLLGKLNVATDENPEFKEKWLQYASEETRVKAHFGTERRGSEPPLQTITATGGVLSC